MQVASQLFVHGAACGPHFARRGWLDMSVRSFLCAASLTLASGPLAAADVPSGQEVILHEVLVDAQEDTTYLRFRFLAPQIATDKARLDFEVVGQDMMHLCETVALSYMTEYALKGDAIVISFMNRVTEFGQSDPDTIQFFESFRLQNGACIWDEF